MIAPSQSCQTPQHIHEPADEFLALFPHRYDYLWADHPDPDQRPQWQTENRHALTDRLVQQGTHLYGVRFESKTGYFMLDIDANSAYHPKHDSFAINRILEALEQIDAVAYVAVTSSQNGGLHLYFPFEQPQTSYKIGRIVQFLLQNAGFKIKPGHLEIFPNARPYQKKLSLYNGHRLPLQLGSYLLNDDFQPVFTIQTEFVRRWEFAQRRNDLTSATIEQIWKIANQNDYTISRNATKFLNDLNAEIEPGWTDFGQTNWILGKIADREFIFRHVLSGGQPLEGEALIAAIVSVAQSLPGYSEYCRHQTDLHKRAKDWARHVAAQRYHYGGTQEKLLGISAQPKQTGPKYHDLKAQDAQERIHNAVADLTSKNELPNQITARERAIAAYGISPRTLRKYLSLWHPGHQADLDHNPEASRESEPALNSLEPRLDKEQYNLAPNKFLGTPACPRPQEAGGQAGVADISSQENFCQNNAQAASEEAIPRQTVQQRPEVTESRHLQCSVNPSECSAPLLERQSRFVSQLGSPSVSPTAISRRERYQQKLQEWLNSGDPILEAEARSILGQMIPPHE
jgi:hypothetical protein